MKEPIYVIIPTTPQRKDRLNICIDAILQSSYSPIIICTYENTLGGCVEPQLKAIENINGIAFIVNDDMILDKECVEKLFESYKYGLLLQPNDSIHNGALATCPYYRFLYSDDNGKPTMVSEDIYFLAMAIGYGVKAYCDTTVVCKHYKPIMW